VVLVIWGFQPPRTPLPWALRANPHPWDSSPEPGRMCDQAEAITVLDICKKKRPLSLPSTRNPGFLSHRN